MKKRTMALLAAVLLIVGGVIGGTLAWLTAKTTPVVNTFTTSDINIELTEDEGIKNAYKFKMVPGYEIKKDPKVTVNGGSEDCFLFVKLEGKNDFDSYLSYTVDSSIWTALTGVPGVYYKKVDASTTNQSWYILTGNKVNVKAEVTKAMMNGLNEANYPKLEITAYASQRYRSNNQEFDAQTAWNNANPIPSN